MVIMEMFVLIVLPITLIIQAAAINSKDQVNKWI